MLRDDTQATNYLNGYMYEQKEFDFLTFLQKVTTEFQPMNTAKFDPYTKSNRGVIGEWAGCELPEKELGAVHIVGESPTEEKIIIIDFAENLTYTVKRKEDNATEVEIIPLDQDNNKTMALLDRSFPKPTANKLVA